MQILGGKLSGRRFRGEPSPRLRPTSNKLREAIFNILDARVVSDWSRLRVLDLFAGTGGLGLEALSRGAELVHFNDHHSPTAKILRDSLRDLKVAENYRVTTRESFQCLAALKDEFDLIFIDPPYREGMVSKVLPALSKVLSPGGVIVIESDKREEILLDEGFEILESRKYGDTILSFAGRPNLREKFTRGSHGL